MNMGDNAPAQGNLHPMHMHKIWTTESTPSRERHDITNMNAKLIQRVLNPATTVYMSDAS